MGEPTCLPSFDRLVEIIGTGTGKITIRRRELVKNTQGRGLKYDKINVHKTAHVNIV